MTNVRWAGCMLAVASCGPSDPFAVEVLREITVPGYPSAPVPVGDIDGDGLPDIAIPQNAFNRELGTRFFAEIYSGRNGSETIRLGRDEDDIVWGTGAIGLGDVDGDGGVDVALAGRDGREMDSSWGLVVAYSGKSGAVLHRLRGLHEGDGFGRAVDACPDLDGDAVGEVLIGARANPGAPEPDARRGYVQVVSGRTGTVLWTLHGDPPWRDGFGSAVADVGDVDHDGTVDVAVAAPESRETAASYLDVFSGRDGHRIVRFDGLRIRGSWGLGDRCNLPGGADFDGDGFSDVVTSSGTTVGFVMILSSHEPALLRLFRQVEPHEFAFAVGLDIAEDLDGDHWPDLLVGHPEIDNGRDFGAIYLISSRTGEVLARVEGSEDDIRLGQTLQWLGDIDGDGRPEFVAGTLGPHGGARIYSVRRL